MTSAATAPGWGASQAASLYGPQEPRTAAALPAALIILFTVFVVLPMVDAATFSFFNWNGYGPITNFVGIENYVDVLTHRNWGTAVATACSSSLFR